MILQDKGNQTACCISDILTNTVITKDSILVNFSRYEYGEGRELVKFGEEVCGSEEAKSQINNPNQFSMCSQVLTKVKIVVDSIRQLVS